jgi:hypothetical protein
MMSDPSRSDLVLGTVHANSNPESNGESLSAQCYTTGGDLVGMMQLSRSCSRALNTTFDLCSAMPGRCKPPYGDLIMSLMLSHTQYRAITRVA